MMYLCKCGRFKSAQPHKSSITKDWICEVCADRRGTTKKPPSVIMKRVRTLEILKRKTIR